MVSDSARDELWGRLDAAGTLADDAQRAHAIARLIADVEPIASDDADLCCLLGRAYYLHPDRATLPWLQDRTQRALERALALDPGHDIARLYLAHHHYDLAVCGGPRGEQAWGYATATRWVNAIASGSLPHHLALRAEEVGLCCTIRIRGLSLALPALERYVERLEASELADVWPGALLECIRDSRASLDPESTKRLRALALRIDAAAAFTDVFAAAVDPDR